jgi:hypothetical protein
MSPAPLPATALFLTIVGALSVAFVVAAHRAGRALAEPPRVTRAWTAGTLLAIGGWLTLTGTFAARGLLHDFSAVPPPMNLLIGASFAITLALAFSPFGSRLSAGLGVAALIGVQSFRLPVEIFLFQMEQAGIVPVQMSFAGLNFDILTGLSAIPVAWLAARGRLPAWGALLWNLIGLGLLLNIVVVAILSTPTSLRVFHSGPANTFITGAPFVWLPTFLVAGALLGHLLLFRRLWRERLAPARATSRGVQVQ